MLAYNSTPHCTTQKSPGELHLGRPLRNALDRLKFFESYCDNVTDSKKKIREFSEGDSVLFRNYGNGPKWLSGRIVKKLSPVTYSLIKFNNKDITFKRHVDQIIKKYVTNDYNDESREEAITNIPSSIPNQNNEESRTSERPKRIIKTPSRYLETV